MPNSKGEIQTEGGEQKLEHWSLSKEIKIHRACGTSLQ